MLEEIIQLNGKEKGPTSIILAGVHGDERCGIEAIEKILPNLTIERGKVFFGYGNPRAIEKNIRFTEANLNRMFCENKMISDNEKKSYEYERAQFLKKYFDQADALLDLHASHTPSSKPFVLCENSAREISKYLPINTIVSGFDDVEPGGTDFYMNSKGKIGICLECGYLGNSQSTQLAEKSILAFLNARGHISGNLRPRKQLQIKIYELYLTKTNDFILAKPFDDFEKISAGQIIGFDGKDSILAEKDSVILFARNRSEIGDEAFLLGE